jgi:hypothetical protein
MSLYLCVFDNSQELDGVEVGPYADFNALRDYIVAELEGGRPGSRFPTLILHSDCDGEWSVPQCYALHQELAVAMAAMEDRPAVPFASVGQAEIAGSLGLVPRNAFESFIDVDGDFVLARLQELTEFALQHKLPVLFQ